MENAQPQPLVAVRCQDRVGMHRRVAGAFHQHSSYHAQFNPPRKSWATQPASRPGGSASPSGHPRRLGWRQRRQCPAEPAPLGLRQLAAPAPAILGEQLMCAAQVGDGGCRTSSAHAAASKCSGGSESQAIESACAVHCTSPRLACLQLSRLLRAPGSRHNARVWSGRQLLAQLKTHAT